MRRLSVSAAIEAYIREMELLRKPGTVYRARHVLTQYQRFARPHDIRQGIIDYLQWCKSRGNANSTLV
ncbi:MAG TPA: hypothetical protein VEK33_12135 [Terriglobales bacterium]|nr:hypothetical protein [Terriglobales bacterium]